MDKNKLASAGLISALGTAAYIVLVALVMQNAERIFGKMNNLLGPVAFLLLFVLSAAVTGALVLGRPVILYWENQKSAAVRLFFYTVGWLFLLTLCALAAQAII